MDSNFDYVVSAAGRVNLIGEHVDYCGGKVFPAALSLKNTIYIKKTGGRGIELHWTDLPETVTIDLSDLERYKTVKHASYFAACAYVLEQSGVSVPGCVILSDCTVPFGGGLSSSAAIEVSFIAALLAIAGIEKTPVEIALLAQKAEREFVGAQCGIMDQYASACGKKDHALLLSCDTLSCRYIPLELGEYALVIANTNKPHSLIGGAYGERREQTARALERLRERIDAPCLAAVTREELEKNKDLLTDVLYKRAKHVVEEVARVEEAAKAMEDGDLERLGALLKASHASLRDLFEVTGKELDALAAAANDFSGCLGSRMTGGGFGGSTVSLVRRSEIARFIEEVGARYEKEIGYKASFYVAEIADGLKVEKLGKTGKKRREVVAALIEKGDRFMICRRPEGKARAGLWEFVGGKAEEGETPEEALVRECAEEIGVQIKVGKKYASVLHDYPDISVYLTIFRATIESGEPRSMEGNAIAWITPSEIPNYTFCDADVDIMRGIFERGALD